ncbi:unnamed protein product, partial [Sphagnum troendelagicum]
MSTTAPAAGGPSPGGTTPTAPSPSSQPPSGGALPPASPPPATPPASSSPPLISPVVSPSPPPPPSPVPLAPPPAVPSPPPPVNNAPPAPSPPVVPSPTSSPPAPPPSPSSSTPPISPANSSPIFPSPPPPPSSVIGNSPPPPHRSLNSPPPPPPNANAPSPSASSFSTAAVIGIAAGGGLIAVIFLSLLLWCCFKKKNRKDDGMGGEEALFVGPGGAGALKAGGRKLRSDPYVPPSDPDTGYNMAVAGSGGGGNGGKVVPPLPQSSPSVGNSRSWFTYDELYSATDGFAAANLLGEGGFGRVYKGHLPSGQVVAVKQLTVGGGQGDREFRAEVEIISRVHHRHLVSLVGYCIADTQRLLVYDFVPNGTLADHLHGKKGGVVMNWATRLKVAVGSARGLAYLHEDCNPRIIHRDIKASNILLDNNFEAQVADFGLAKLASDANTHVTTRVMGTFGYLAPEYAASGKLTEKSDVFSFGVVLLELITGRKAVDPRQPLGDESLAEWARPLMTQALEDGNIDQIVDPELRNDYDEKEMFRMIEAAAACVRHSASKRPKMAQVVRALESDAENAGLYQGLKPGHSVDHNAVFGGSRFGGGSSDYDTQQYNADMQKFRKLALGSQHLGSEYASTSGVSSEYDANPSSTEMQSDFNSGE